MMKSCIKVIISNYVDTFTKIDVKVLTFYKILIIVCSIIFEIVLWYNYNNMANYLRDIFAQLNLERIVQ